MSLRPRSMLRSVPGTRVRAVLSLGVVFGLGTVGTLAAWNDAATATSGTFATGTVDLRLDGAKNQAYTSLSLTEALPGESVATQWTVQNAGSLPLSYTVSAAVPAGSPALAGHLRLALYGNGPPSNPVTAGMRTGRCGGPRIAEVALAPASPVDVTTDPRVVAANDGSDPLCVVLGVSASAPVNVQNQKVTAVTLTFRAGPVKQP